MSTVKELIELLQQYPEDMEVEVEYTDNCCCGDCFLGGSSTLELDVSNAWVYEGKLRL